MGKLHGTNENKSIHYYNINLTFLHQSACGFEYENHLQDVSINVLSILSLISSEIFPVFHGHEKESSGQIDPTLFVSSVRAARLT